jgi:hypothetical protein
MASEDMDVDIALSHGLNNLALDHKELDALLVKSNALLTEVDAFIAHLKAQPRLDKIEYRHFRSDIANELASLSKVNS